MVSIPSQAGILLAVRHRSWSNVPARSSLNTLSGGHPLGGEQIVCHALTSRLVSIPSQAGILLADGNAHCDPARPERLNTLSGGHPLGGCEVSRRSRSASRVSIPSQAGILLAGRHVQSVGMQRSSSQYPLRRASSWRRIPVRVWIVSAMVSIPSQAGILLAGQRYRMASAMTVQVSIPSQAGILLAGARLTSRRAMRRSSQYPLRRASSWRFGISDGQTPSC